jgi:hypothetical protein
MSIPAIVTYREPFSISLELTNENEAREKARLRDEVSSCVAAFVESWPDTKLVRINGATRHVNDHGAMRLVEIDLVIQQNETDRSTGASYIPPIPRRWFYGYCEVKVQSIG